MPSALTGPAKVRRFSDARGRGVRRFTFQARPAARLQAKAGKTVSIMAYGGGPVEIDGQRVVFDLSGLRPSGQIPLLRDHCPDRVVGRATPTIGQKSITAAGELFDVAEAEELIALAEQQHSWQISIGVDDDDSELVPAGKTAFVNGRIISGPAEVVRRGTLREISFVGLGADPTAHASIAARRRKRFAEDGSDELLMAHYTANKSGYEKMGVTWQQFSAAWKSAKKSGMKLSEFIGTTEAKVGPPRKFADPPSRVSKSGDAADALVERHFLDHQDQYAHHGTKLADWMLAWELAKARGMSASEFCGDGSARIGDEVAQAARPRTFADLQIAGGREASQVYDHFQAFSESYQRIGCTITPAEAVRQFLQLRAIDPTFTAREYLAGKTPRMPRPQR